MRYGMNLLLWTGELNDSLIPVLHMLKMQGYDGVELPLFNLDLDYAKWGKKLDEQCFVFSGSKLIECAGKLASD